MEIYRSRHHPENGQTYIVSRTERGDVLISSSGIKYTRDCWDYSDLELIQDELTTRERTP